jgi:hypothetical protein
MVNRTSAIEYAETRAQSALATMGIITRRANHRSPFDLYTERGTRIEVKQSAFRYNKFGPYTRIEGKKKHPITMRGWFFNLQRHGVMDQDNVDFYLFLCDPSPTSAQVFCTDAFYVVAVSPLDGKVECVTLDKLIKRNPRFFYQGWQIIKDFDVAKPTPPPPVPHKPWANWKPWEHWITHPKNGNIPWVHACNWLLNYIPIHSDDRAVGKFVTMHGVHIEVLRTRYKERKRFEGWKFLLGRDREPYAPQDFYLLQALPRDGEAGEPLYKLVHRSAFPTHGHTLQMVREDFDKAGAISDLIKQDEDRRLDSLYHKVIKGK